MASHALTAVETYYSISELANRHGVSLRTLRFYEDKGLLQPLRLGQMRLYTAKDQIRLQLIIKGKQLGLSLRCIADLLERSGRGDAPADRAGMAERLDKKFAREQLSALQAQRDRVDDAIRELERTLEARNIMMVV